MYFGVKCLLSCYFLNFNVSNDSFFYDEKKNLIKKELYFERYKFSNF